MEPEPSERFVICIEHIHNGYKASCAQINIYVEASTFEELKGDINQAVNESLAKKENIPSLIALQYVYDLPSFFDTHKIINAADLAKRIGISKSLLSQYIRGNKKPSRLQIQRILAAIRDIGNELAAVEFLL